MMRLVSGVILAAVILCFNGCGSVARAPLPAAPIRSEAPTSGEAPIHNEVPACVCPEPARPSVPQLQAVAWETLPEWGQQDLSGAFKAFLLGCHAARPQFTEVCSAATQLATDQESIRGFFETRFAPFQFVSAEAPPEGLITGYYEPLIRGSRQRTAKYQVPVYGPPADLVTVELSELYPELKGLRLRGRVEGKKLLPYYTREEIGSGKSVPGKILFWARDPVELFFVQVQGSARVQLESGEMIRINFAEQNGHPYRSVGRALVERGELPLDKASMQGIKAWGRQHPDKLDALLNVNPSYVFFRELPDSPLGPIGALGIPLSAGYSIAVDPRYVPLGAPVYLSTTMPASSQPLKRLTMAQDTGGAIRGAARADFYWGSGEEAGELAGRMRQMGKLWVLMPVR